MKNTTIRQEPWLNITEVICAIQKTHCRLHTVRVSIVYRPILHISTRSHLPIYALYGRNTDLLEKEACYKLVKILSKNFYLRYDPVLCLSICYIKISQMLHGHMIALRCKQSSTILLYLMIQNHPSF